MHEGAVLFAYILGAALFGWYGLFLGPFLLVIVIQFANIVMGDLISGKQPSPAPTATMNLGTDPTDAEVDIVDETSSDRVGSGGDHEDTNTDDGVDR